MLRLAKLLAGIVIVLGCAAPAAAAKRVALVIGNGAYKAQNLLVNPPSDARIISGALAKAGFETIETKTDLGIAQFRQSLRRFQSQANGADVALIYYAGHGIEANGANWLIPTDADLAEDRDLDYEAIKADLVLQALQGANMRVLVLDACRDNPFGRTWRSGTRNVSRGLAQLEADDVLVLFAAAPGRTASDGVGTANSPFARALSKRLPEPGLAIQLLGGSVRDDVLAATGGAQRPYVSASITGRPFYLVPSEPASPPQQVTVPPEPRSAGAVAPSAVSPPSSPVVQPQPPAERNTPSAPSVEAPKVIAAATPPRSAPTELPSAATREAAQRELKRIGCYVGEIDGDWGRGSQAALQEFRRRSRTQVSGDAEPTAEVVAELARHGPGLCPAADVTKPAVAKPANAKPRPPAQADNKPASSAPRRASQGPADSTGKSREQCMTCCLAQRFDPASFSSIRICEGFCSSRNNRC